MRDIRRSDDMRKVATRRDGEEADGASQELHAEARTSLLAMNQVTRWIVTKEEHCKNIIKL